MRLSIMPLLIVSSSQFADHPHHHPRQVRRPHQHESAHQHLRVFSRKPGLVQAPRPRVTVVFLTLAVLAQGGGGVGNNFRPWCACFAVSLLQR